MSVTSLLHPSGHLVYSLTHGDQQVSVSAFGGQINAWAKAGTPVIFENRERAIVDGKTAYRGGAPVCFPYFGKGSLLPLGTTFAQAHGRARVSVWDSQVHESENAVVLTNRQPSPEGYGPTEFACELIYTLGEELNIRATVRNVGVNEAPFQLALHTYWATDDPSSATATGLGDLFLDNLQGLAEQREIDSSVPHPTPVDRVYPDAEAKLVLSLGLLKVEISTSGCSGAVLWNPGKNHTVADLGSPDFICLESGLITPSKSLAPAEEYVIEVAYLAQPL